MKAKEIFEADYLNICRKTIANLDFESIFSYDPSPLQSSIIEMDVRSPAMYIVEDATGAGKTEAALIQALKYLEASNLDGITFALPTRSTSNLMFTRLNGYSSSMLSDSASVTLQHASSRTFLDNSGIEIDKGWTFGKNKALFANISVCTIDQMLCSVIPVRYQPLKLLAAARHVVIIDEVHAYDAYTFGLLCHFVRYCKIYGIPLILLSATLPSVMKQQLIDSYGCSLSDLSSEYPLITECKADVIQVPVEPSIRSIRSISVRYVSDSKIIIDEMRSLASEGMRVCWIRNTVDDAIEAFDSIPDGNYRTMLLHSRFILADRINLENEVFAVCGKDGIREGIIVVATQIIEQSLDIEFERVYSDLAPMDALIQRMGRDQRFNDSPIGCEFVVNGPLITADPKEDWYSAYFPRASFVYRDHNVLFNTAMMMQGGTMSVPVDYRRMIEYAYSEPEKGSPFYENHKEFHGIIKGSIANYRRIVLDPNMCYGCSLASEFSDSQWDAIQRATTRETDDRTVQCMLVCEDGETIKPISGDPETSLVAVKRKNARGIDIPHNNYGKWASIVKVLMFKKVDGSGVEYWMNDGGLKYSSTRGLEYV